MAVSLLLIGFSLPLIRRRIKPNALYGLRVTATFEDDRVWYEANARSGRDLLALGIVQLLLALLLPLIPGLSEEAYLLSNAGVLLAGALLSCLVGQRRATRLLSEMKAGETR